MTLLDILFVAPLSLILFFVAWWINPKDQWTRWTKMFLQFFGVYAYYLALAAWHFKLSDTLIVLFAIIGTAATVNQLAKVIGSKHNQHTVNHEH